jgi:hypothetical protein
MRSKLSMIAAIAAIVVGGLVFIPAMKMRLGSTVGDAGAAQNPSPPTADSPSLPAPPPQPATLRAHPVSVAVDGFYAWALLDRKTGQIAGSPNITATNSTESMIKIWIVSDFLRRTAAAGKAPTAAQLKLASTAIRDSNDSSAESLFNLGGRAAVITRLIGTCGLTETKAVVPPGRTTVWWSYTRISARDAVRMGVCVADGRAAGPKWTAWVLNEMANVRGTTAPQDQHPAWGGGRWGIIDGLPPEILSGGVSIKNGWTVIGVEWHVNCLAVHPAWVLAVLIRYPMHYGLQYGADICRSVTGQLVYPPPTGS